VEEKQLGDLESRWFGLSVDAGDNDLSELVHTVSDKVEAAYRRGDLFEKRRDLMEPGLVTVSRAIREKG